MPTVGAPALQRCDLIVSQGADNELTFRYGELNDAGQPVWYNLTGWHARSQIRARAGDGVPWYTADTATNTILLDSDGHVTVLIPHAATQTEAWDTRSKGVWDVELTDPSGVRVRLVEGVVTVSHDVTRDADGT